MHTARLRQDATAGVTAFSSLQRLLVQILRVLKWNASSILHPRIITPISARDYTHDAKANEQRTNGHLYEFWLGAAENLICFQINKKIGCLFKKQGIVIEWQPWYFNIDNIRMPYRHHGREVRKKRMQIHIHTYTMYIQGSRRTREYRFPVQCQARYRTLCFIYQCLYVSCMILPSTRKAPFGGQDVATWCT